MSEGYSGRSIIARVRAKTGGVVQHTPTNAPVTRLDFETERRRLSFHPFQPFQRFFQRCAILGHTCSHARAGARCIGRRVGTVGSEVVV